MAYTLAEYDTLKSAIASGAMEVSYSDKTVKYRTLSEMQQILRLMAGELFPPTPPVCGYPGRVFASFDKGVY